jgi:hypothetical protein
MPLKPRRRAAWSDSQGTFHSQSSFHNQGTFHNQASFHNQIFPHSRLVPHSTLSTLKAFHEKGSFRTQGTLHKKGSFHTKVSSLTTKDIVLHLGADGAEKEALPEVVHLLSGLGSIVWGLRFGVWG